METSKFLRLSIPGWMLLLSFAIFKYTIEGFNIPDNIKSNFLITIVSLILTSSLLGVIISTISYSFIHCIFGHRLYFPFRKKWSKRYHSTLFKSLSAVYSNEIQVEIEELKLAFEGYQGKKRINKTNSRKLFDFYQILLRQEMNPLIFQYSQRAWDFYYLNLNNIFSVILGFFLAIPFNKEISCKTNYVIIIIFFIYLVSAFCHLSKCRKDAVNVEMNWLESNKYHTTSSKTIV